MQYSITKSTEFVVEAKDPDELHELIGNIDNEKLETIIEWVFASNEPPIIEEYERVNKDTPVHMAIQKEMNEVKKAWEAL